MRIYVGQPQREQQQNEALQEPIENLPFWNKWLEFREANRGKQICLILGIGTSGSRNPVEIAEYIRQKHQDPPEKAFFVLLIDGEYQEEGEVTRSLSRLISEDEGFGYQREQEQPSVSAKQVDTGDVFYLWGVNLPSAHRGTAAESMQRYSDIRDNPIGPYEYGRACRIEDDQDIMIFYQRLLRMFQNRAITNIAVYNQGFTNARILGYGRDVHQRYQGPMFQGEARVVPLDRASTMINEGLYFENFCEILYCLSQSRKPVIALRKDDRDTLVEIPMYNHVVANRAPIGGRRKKKSRKSRRKSRSQSRRKATR